VSSVDGSQATITEPDGTALHADVFRPKGEGKFPTVLARTHAFCLRGVAASLRSIQVLCPVTIGFAAPGRILDEVSFINAAGLVRRMSIRRVGQPSLAFFDRPEWMHAWFPG
jgi:hypothetical protein